MNQEADPRDAQLRSLANLLLLETRLRQAATVAELGYVLTNDIRVILPNDTALFWRSNERLGRVESVSGLPEPAAGAPFTVFARRLCRNLFKVAEQQNPRRIDFESLDRDLATEAREFLPPETLWAPLVTSHGRRLGGLIVGRATPWGDEELRVLGRVVEAAAQALLVQMAARRWKPRRPIKLRIAIAIAVAAIVAAMTIPVRLSILAPAEVVAKDPLIVRAPLDGVIGKVMVKPNQTVVAGDLLFRLDGRSLQTKLAVAQQELEVARAEYRQAQQGAGQDPQASAKLPVLAAEIVQKNAEVEYEQALLDRVDVRAPGPGIIILPDVTHLEGKPVSLGERIMTLADPKAVVLEAWIPVQDNIPLSHGAAVDLFLNVNPDRPLPAAMNDVDYQAQPMPGELIAYRATASFTGTAPPPRIGLRGTARLFGDRVSLFYYLFRRPWAAARPWLQW